MPSLAATVKLVSPTSYGRGFPSTWPPGKRRSSGRRHHLGAVADRGEDPGRRDTQGGVSEGPEDESAQTVEFIVDNDNSGLFTQTGQPAIDPATGDLTYAPKPNANGSATVTVKAKDDGGTASEGDVDTSAEKTFAVAVNPINDAPSAEDGTASMDEDGAPISIDLGPLVSDEETKNDADLTYAIVSGPSEAQGVLSGSGPTYTFDSAENYNGAVEVTYKVTDRGDPDGCAAPDPCAARGERREDREDNRQRGQRRAGGGADGR